MEEHEHHAMQLVATHESGAEEWFCPTCGRRFLMQWPPAYKKIVLEPGDEYAIHSGGKGGLQMGVPEVRQGQDDAGLLGLVAADPAPAPAEATSEYFADGDDAGIELSDEELAPWKKFLDGLE